MKKKVSKEAKKEQTPKLGEGKAKTPRKNKEERQGEVAKKKKKLRPRN